MPRDINGHLRTAANGGTPTKTQKAVADDELEEGLAKKGLRKAALSNGSRKAIVENA